MYNLGALDPYNGPARSKTESLAPPVRGLSATESEAAMHPLAALILDNWVAFPESPMTRMGAVDWVTGFAENNVVESLVVWNGPSSQKMFGCTDQGIYDVSVAGTVGAAVQAYVKGEQVSSVMISTGGTHRLILVNGLDTMRQFDGTTWTAVATLGALATTTLSAIELYKQRLFMLEKNTMNMHYLAPNSVTGTATAYPLGAIFPKGGSLVSLATWTLDGGSGPDDYLAVATSEGEVAVFTGIDPASSWQLVGVYHIARPIGGCNSLMKYGADVLFMTESGIMPLRSALDTAAADRRRSALSDNIRQLYVNLVQSWGTFPGWQMLAIPDVPILIVNVPEFGGGKQLVMHAQTKAWSTFSGWTATCFARMGNQVFYAMQGKVVQAWTGFADFGADIVSTLLQAYNPLGSPLNKQILMARAVLRSTSKVGYTIGVDTDFRRTPSENIISGSASSAATWGSGIWGSSYWVTGTNITRDWRKVHDLPGVYKALYLSIRSRTAQVTHSSTDLLLAGMGVF